MSAAVVPATDPCSEAPLRRCSSRAAAVCSGRRCCFCRARLVSRWCSSVLVLVRLGRFVCVCVCVSVCVLCLTVNFSDSSDKRQTLSHLTARVSAELPYGCLAPQSNVIIYILTLHYQPPRHTSFISSSTHTADRPIVTCFARETIEAGSCHAGGGRGLQRDKGPSLPPPYSRPQPPSSRFSKQPAE